MLWGRIQLGMGEAVEIEMWRNTRGSGIFSLLVWGRSCDRMDGKELRKGWCHFLPV